MAYAPNTIVSNIADLQAATATTLTSSQAYVLGYATASDGGEGMFVLGATTTADGGTIINDAAGRSWYRQSSGAVNIKWFGANGNGTTDNTAVFDSLELSALLEFYVPEGVFYAASINQGGLTKTYTGPGVVKYGTQPLKMNNPQAILKPAHNPLSRVSAGTATMPRSLVFVGDSITAAYPVGYAGGFPAQINQKIAAKSHLPVASQIPFCDLDYVTTSGAVTIGTTGPIGRSYILPPGASVSFVSDYVDLLQVYYAQSSTTTELTITGGAFNETLTTAAGTNPCVVLGALSINRGGLGVTYTFMNSGSNPLEINGFFVSHFNNSQGVTVQVMAYPGYTTENYISAEALNAIATQTFNGASNPVYVVGLGTNDAFSATAAITPAAYEANLKTIVGYLVETFNNASSVVLFSPMMPYGSSATTPLAPFNEYRDALYEVAREYSCDVIDGTEFDMNANSAVLHYDGLHPSQIGYNALSDWLFNKLGLDAIELPPIYSAIAVDSGFTANNAFSVVAKNKKATFSGYVSVSGTVTYPAVIGTIANVGAFAPIEMKYLYAGTNPYGGASITISTAGVITALNGPSTPGFFFFDGLAYELDY